MKRLTAVLGYLLAALALPIVLATFVGMTRWERGLVALTGLRVSPWFTGGEVAASVRCGRFETRVHEPVFQALVGERDDGFVQITLAPSDSLPPVVREEIDYDRDGRPDFVLTLDTAAPAAEVEPLDERVGSVRGVVRLDDGIAVRVNLSKTGR
jgi:hypothetical protein